MKKSRKELSFGLLLLIFWLVLKIIPRWDLLMGLVLIAGIALVVIGLLPENLYEKAKVYTDKILGKLNKKA